MRIAYLTPLLLVAACNVERDEQNDTTTMQFNEEAAEGAASEVANEAEEIGGHIVNDVQETGAAVQNEVGDVDVDVDVDRDGQANAQ